MVMLSGVDYCFELMNFEYCWLIGGCDVIGQWVDVVLLEVVWQGYVLLLDYVFFIGEIVKCMFELVFLNCLFDVLLEQWFLDFVYQLICDDFGVVMYIFVQGLDVMEWVCVESYQCFLINELNYWVKNMLVLIQLIVGQMLCGVFLKDEVLWLINVWILVLLWVYDVLMQENWDGVDLCSIIDSVISVFCDWGDVFCIDGLDLCFGLCVVLVVVFVVYELGMNVLQYGVLFVFEGQVSICWCVDDCDIFWLEWVEIGGLLVIFVSCMGFGLCLIFEVLLQELYGVVYIDYWFIGMVFVLESLVVVVSDKFFYCGEVDGMYFDC